MKSIEFTAAEIATLFSALRLYQRCCTDDRGAQLQSHVSSVADTALYPTPLDIAGFEQLCTKLNQSFIEYVEPWLCLWAANSTTVQKHVRNGEISLTTPFGEVTRYGPYALSFMISTGGEGTNTIKCIACDNERDGATWAGLCGRCADVVGDANEVETWVTSNYGIRFIDQSADSQHALRVKYIQSVDSSKGVLDDLGIPRGIPTQYKHMKS